MNKPRGFTVVELIVVIVVVALIGSVAVISYASSRDHAKDTIRRVSVQQIQQAVDSLKMRRDETLFVGGYHSFASAPPDANGFCTYNTNSASSGVTAANWVYHSAPTSNHRCTFGQMLMGTGVLPKDFFSELPPNEEYVAAVARQSEAAMTMYLCETGTTRWALYYYIKYPTQEESDSLTEVRASCNTGPGESDLRNTLKMRAAIELRL